MKFVLLALSALILCGCSYKPQIWNDEKTGTSIFVQKLPAASDLEGVRNVSAGWIEGLFEEGLFLPNSAGTIEVHGFPGLLIKGDGQGKNAGLHAMSAIVFGKNGAYTILGLSAEEIPLSMIEAHSSFEGPPYTDATAVLSEIAPKISDGLPEFRKILQKGVDSQAQAKQTPTSTTSATTP